MHGEHGFRDMSSLDSRNVESDFWLAMTADSLDLDRSYFLYNTHIPHTFSHQKF